MFTGIIEGFGKITGLRASGRGKRLTIESGFSLDQTKIGDSIAVSGACLTAVVIQGEKFEVDVSPETLDKTTLCTAKTGDRVNLERALRLSDRLDGHLVSGHIDGTGKIIQKKKAGNVQIVTIGVPESLSDYMIEKGSVAVDGISLTINKCDRQNFEVSIIPHTSILTTIGFKKIGDNVNIETDMIGKYVERFISKKPVTEKEKQKKDIDATFLAKSGFI